MSDYYCRVFEGDGLPPCKCPGQVIYYLQHLPDVKEGHNRVKEIISEKGSIEDLKQSILDLDIALFNHQYVPLKELDPLLSESQLKVCESSCPMKEGQMDVDLVLCRLLRYIYPAKWIRYALRTGAENLIGYLVSFCLKGDEYLCDSMMDRDVVTWETGQIFLKELSDESKQIVLLDWLVKGGDLAACETGLIFLKELSDESKQTVLLDWFLEEGGYEFDYFELGLKADIISEEKMNQIAGWAIDDGKLGPEDPLVLLVDKGAPKPDLNKMIYGS